MILYFLHAGNVHGLQGLDGKSSPNLSPLIQVLLGMKPPAAKEKRDNLTFFDVNLNDSQKIAVRFCLESPEVACIHGPPGVYSSHYISALTYREVQERGKHIL